MNPTQAEFTVTPEDMQAVRLIAEQAHRDGKIIFEKACEIIAELRANATADLRTQLAERDAQLAAAHEALGNRLVQFDTVIEMAEKALTGLVMAYISLCSKHGENFHKCEGSWSDHAQHVLDEIAKLRKE